MFFFDDSQRVGAVAGGSGPNLAKSAGERGHAKTLSTL